MNTVYLILGTNKGDKNQNLQSALIFIENDIGKILKKSGVYITKPWGNENQPDFFNQAVSVKTNLSPLDLLKEVLTIEKKLGRIRTTQKWTERTMDIDILFYDNKIIDVPHLKIPHPFIQQRRFVLIPLAEIAKDFIHPVLNKSIEKLLEECVDSLEVVPFDK